MGSGPYDDFARYLKAKTTVDDRAIHPRVWSLWAKHLRAAQQAGRIRLVEAGAGIGTMIVRMLEGGLLERAEYDAVEADSRLAPAASSHLRAWAEANGWRVGPDLALSKGDRRIAVHWHPQDLFDFLGSAPAGEADGVVAHAVLDLLDLDEAVPRLIRLLRPGGLFLFTLTFDGVTAFLPEDEGAYEVDLLRAYHRTMDARIVQGAPSGHSRSGRRLLEGLPRWGGRILEAGPSDWLVLPHGGVYPGDEGYFLHHIVETVRGALESDAGVGGDSLERWAAGRHRQIDRGEMALMAHQWDVVGTIE
jgi:SAM-dependent methyltransferase